VGVVIEDGDAATLFEASEAAFDGVVSMNGSVED